MTYYVYKAWIQWSIDLTDIFLRFVNEQIGMYSIRHLTRAHISQGAITFM